MRAYKAHPETFFGRAERVTKNIGDPIDMFEWMLNSYETTPREKILEWMKAAPDIHELSKLSDEELRLIYVERCVYAMMSKASNSPKKAGERGEQKVAKDE